MASGFFLMRRRLYRWRVSTHRRPTTCDYARMSGECRTGGLSSLPVRRKDRLCAHSFRTGHQLGRAGMGRWRSIATVSNGRIPPLQSSPVERPQSTLSGHCDRPSSGTSRRRRPRGSRRNGRSWSRLGDAGYAHGFEQRLELGQVRRVVAQRRPVDAGARDGKGRVDRDTGLDRGMRLVKSTKRREGEGQLKIRSIGSHLTFKSR